MDTLKNQTTRLLIAFVALLSLCANVHAWAPNNSDLGAAVNAGDFGAYFANISTWLTQKVPADSSRISEAAMKALLKDPVFVNTLDQRQLLAKHGVANVEVFARAAQGNKMFLAWLLQNTEAMDLYLEGATPSGANNRALNKWAIPIASLDVWNKIRNADPDAKTGMYQKLAIATALALPGSGNKGAGMSKTPADPVDRYKHFKSANVNKELFPSFNHLTVWEYQKIVSSCASDRDLAWAREMLNTWRPDLRINQQVVNSTSEVWRRGSPFPYTDFASVLAGGGKCGPRSSWAVMICQAFGIPAIGVGQPAHACVAYKAHDPSLQPQPGSVWKVAHGRGWDVSTLEGMKGPEFLEDVAARSRLAEFSQVEHLRWLAATLISSEQAAAVMVVARKLQQSAPATKTVLTASEKAEEAEKEVAPKSQSSKVAPTPTRIAEAPFTKKPGTLHVEAESFATMSGICVYDCFTGGKQVNFQKNMKSSWVDYKVDVPATGMYGLELRVAAPNFDQVIDVSSGATKIATVNIPNTRGLWETTTAVDIALEKGTQTLRLSTPFQRGIAVRWFELKSRQ